jgi:flagellar assembly protein FliH
VRILRYVSLNLRDFRTPFDALHAKTAQEVVVEAPPPPPPPTFSQMDMEAARQAAHKEGFEEGVQAGVAKVVNETHLRDNDASEAMKKLASDINALSVQYQEVLAKQGKELTEMVMLIARKVAGDALTQHADKMIEEMVVRCLPVIIYKPRVIIDVHAEILEKVEGHLTTLLRESGFTGDITVRAGSSIARHDIKIDWAAGYAERSTEALWSEVTILMNEIALRTHDNSTSTNEMTT